MTWHAAPSIGAVLSQANSLWPDRCRISDGIIGDARHQAEVSDHNPDSRGVVHAVDLTHGPYYKTADVDCRKVADAIVARRDPRVAYIIFDGRICSSTVSPWTWRPYSGFSKHQEHLHISILHTAAAEDDTSPWFTTAPADQLTDAETEAVVSRLDVLKKGSDDDVLAGTPVHAVQWNLIGRGLLPSGSADGSFGPVTETAVCAFQKAAGLDVDGIVSKGTWYALNA